MELSVGVAANGWEVANYMFSGPTAAGENRCSSLHAVYLFVQFIQQFDGLSVFGVARVLYRNDCRVESDAGGTLRLVERLKLNCAAADFGHGGSA